MNADVLRWGAARPLPPPPPAPPVLQPPVAVVRGPGSTALVAAAVVTAAVSLSLSFLIPPVALAVGITALVLGVVSVRGTTGSRAAWAALAVVFAGLALIVSTVVLVTLTPVRIDGHSDPVVQIWPSEAGP